MQLINFSLTLTYFISYYYIIMESYPKSSRTGKCACGTQCSCGSNCQCGDSSDLSPELYEFSFPRRAPAEIIELEEKERQDRLSTGVNALLYAKIFRLQTELMHKNIPTSLLNNARSSLLSAKETTRDASSSLSEKMQYMGERISTGLHSLVGSFKGKEAELEARAQPIIADIDKRTQEFSVSTNNFVKDARESLGEISEDINVATREKAGYMKTALKESAKEISDKSTDFAVATNNLVGDIKDKIMGPDIASMAMEEKERARRMAEKVDPVIEGKRHRVESELLTQVKMVN